jgi:hypothetical protein
MKRIRLLIPLFILAAVVGSVYAYIQNQRVAGPLTGLSVSRDGRDGVPLPSFWIISVRTRDPKPD